MGAPLLQTSQDLKATRAAPAVTMQRRRSRAQPGGDVDVMLEAKR